MTTEVGPESVVEYGPRRLLIVVGVMLAALLQTLDSTIVNVALPTIEGNLGASLDEATWVVTGYIISNVIAIPLAPFLMQRLGRRQYFAGCIFGFTAASMLCGTAHSLEWLVFFRILQGAFGGGLIATSQIILRDTFPPKMIGTSSALFAIGLTVGPTLGPTLGGILTDNLSWQWVFDINLIPGLAAGIIILTSLKNPTRPRAIPFDFPGLALLAVGLGSMQFVLNEGERNDWLESPMILGFAAAAIAGIVGFIAWELRGTKEPIVDLRVFRHRNVRVGTGMALLMGTVVFGPLIIIPQYGASILGFTSTGVGLLLLLRAVPAVILMPFIARLAGGGVIDPRWLLTAGYALSGGALMVLVGKITSVSDFGTLAGWHVIAGIGNAALLVPLLVIMLSSVPRQESPKVSSFISLSVQLGASISSSGLVTVFDRRAEFHYAMLASGAVLTNPAVARLASLPHATARLYGIIQQQATTMGFADAMLIASGCAMCAIGLAWFLVVRRPEAPVVVTAAE